MSLLIRAGTADDSRSIAELHVRAWRRHYPGIMPADLLDGLDPARVAGSWSQACQDTDREVHVAVRDGRLAGFAYAGPAEPDTGPAGSGELLAFYTDVEDWAPTLPYRLMRAALAALDRRGLAPVRLWVLADNHHAREYFGAFGFAFDGGERRQRFGGAERDVLRYRLEPRETAGRPVMRSAHDEGGT
jgi:ribosomal protein S18 acetylase RimI-like enzyme